MSEIKDGYTLDATIPAKPGEYEQLTVSYRRALASERIALNSLAMHAGREDVYAARCLDTLTKRVGSWSLGDKVTREQLETLHPEQFGELLDYVLGYRK